MAAIDVHAHLYPAPYLEALRRLGDEPGSAGEAARGVFARAGRADPALRGALDERLALMDAAEIDLQVLSIAAPNVWHPDPTARAALVRAFNDGCAEVVRAHLGRFAFFGNVPLPFVDAAIAEAARALDELGALGVSTCTHVAGRPIDAPEFEPFYGYLNERQAVLFFHPDGFCAPGALDDFLGAWALGVLFDDSIAVLRLVTSGLVERYPQITWIVPHLGGTIPFVAGRLDRVWHNGQRLGLLTETQAAVPAPPSAYLRRLYYDVVTYQANALSLAKDVLGMDRLLYGTDFPLASRQSLATGRDMLRDAGFTAAEIARIMRDNAVSALRLVGEPGGTVNMPGRGA